METNALGVVNLLRASIANRISTFVQISTDEVYGSILVGSWDENSPLDPSSPYSASKASGDLACMSFYKTFGLDVRITRCSNNYGPRQYPEKLIPNFITRLLKGETVPIYGRGENIRDWLHVEDHCQGIERVIEHGKPGNIYNIGGGSELSNIELTLKLIDAFGLDDSYICFIDDRKGHDFRYSLNYDKARQELGYSPKVDFEKGLQSTIDWYLKKYKTI